MNRVCTGSNMVQENLIQESFTLMDSTVISVREALRLVFPKRAAFTLLKGNPADDGIYYTDSMRKDPLWEWKYRKYNTKGKM